MNYKIRDENVKDYYEVENVTREAFWNLYRPGCIEHLVIHNLRNNQAFIKELAYVIEYNEEIIGSIIYSYGILKLDKGGGKDLINFGPVSIRPDYQGKGIGNKLITTSIDRAKELGYDVIFITGNPKYYNRFGFEPACQYGIYLDEKRDSKEAEFFMVKLLKPGALDGLSGIYVFDSCFYPSMEELEEYDKQFPPKIKEKRPGQFEE
jgi:predicted N-acetyltransferase YhbS